MLDLGPDIEARWDDYQAAFARVMRSGQFIRGNEVRQFEAEVAAFLGVPADRVVSVASGTDALVIGLRALGIGCGDEVITTPFTFAATAEAICLVGARPVFVDIDPGTFNIDPERIAAAITPATRAILPVHLFGQPAKITEVQELAARHSLLVLEDCAQAFGAQVDGRPVGTLGDAGAFSFFPSKNLGGFGDGGLVVTQTSEHAAAARALSNHGAAKKYANETVGYNSRLDELQAALLRVRLPQAPAFNEARRAVAAAYREAIAASASLAGHVELPPSPAGDHVFHQFAIRVPADARDRIADGMRARGVATAVYYPTPCSRLPAYARFADNGPPHPEADRAAASILHLPIGPHLRSDQIEQVVAALSESLAELSR